MILFYIIMQIICKEQLKMMKIVSAILAFTILFTSVCISPVSVGAKEPDNGGKAETMPLLDSEADSDTVTGTCGENITWSLSLSDGTLTIMGSGEMPDDFPWSRYRDRITELVIGDGITRIADNAFSDMMNLKTVKLGSGLKIIGRYAFAYCEMLESLTLPETLEEIHGFAFRASGLKSIDIPASTVYVTDAFRECDCLEEINVDPENHYLSSVDGVLFTADGANLLLYPAAKNGESYTVPCEVYELGDYSFSNCRNLKTLTVGEDVSYIGYSALGGGNSISEYKVAEGNTYFTTEDGVLFSYDKTSLIRYPSNKAGKTYTINGNVEFISAFAFSTVNALEQITVSDGVKDIGIQSFERCSNLSKINFPDSLVSIESMAFSFCNLLKSVKLPASVSWLSSDTFMSCQSLERIDTDEDNTEYSSLDGVLYNKDKTVLMCYPAGKTDIFFKVPESVEDIQKRSFAQCVNLAEIYIPGKVAVGNNAFMACDNLTILGTEGSPAEQYAERYGYNFKTVYPAESIQKVEVGIMPEKTVYGIGGTPNYKGLVLKITFKDGGEQTVTDGYSVLGYDFSVAGDTVIRMSYVGFDFSVPVTVDENMIIYPETSHPAEKRRVNGYSYTHKTDAYMLSITFSEETDLGQDGWLDLFDGNGRFVEEYFGTELAGKTIEVNGNSFSVECCFFESVYGFSIEKIEEVEDTRTTSGEFGDGNTWTYDKETATLTLSGEGEIYEGDCPWLDYYSDSVRKAVIEEGITYVPMFAFDNCKKLTEVSVPSTVEYISPSAVNRCTSFEAFNVAQNNEYYSSDDGILYNKAKNRLLVYPCAKEGETFDVPESVKTIASAAFEENKNLLSVSVPDSVTTIELMAFSRCRSLKSVYIGSGAEQISDQVFWDCENLEAITVSENNKSYCSVNGVLFTKDMTKLLAYPSANSRTEYTVPSAVNEIGEAAFNNCKNLVTVDLGENLEKIGSSNLRECDNLETVVLPDSLTEIGEMVLYFCNNLKNVNIPAAVTKIGADTLYPFDNDNLSVSVCPGTAGETYVIENGIKHTLVYDSSEIIEVTLNTLPKKTVYAVGEPFVPYGLVLAAKYSDGQVSFINSGYTVGEYDFSTAGEKLISVTYNGFEVKIPVTVDASAAKYPESAHPLTAGEWTYTVDTPAVGLKVTFSEGCDLGDTYAGIYDSNGGCVDIVYGTDLAGKTYTIDGNSFRIVINDVYEDCFGFIIESIELINSGKCGENTRWSFDPETGVLKVTGEGSMDDTEYSGKRGWYSLMPYIREVEICDGVTYIGAWNFESSYIDSQIEKVTVAGSVKEIGTAAFSGCTKMKTAVLSQGLETIGESAFAGCSALENVRLPDSLRTVGKMAFRSCGKLTEIVIPEGVTLIDSIAFDLCDNLTTYYFPASLETFESPSFTSEKKTTVYFAGKYTKVDEWTYGYGFTGNGEIELHYTHCEQYGHVWDGGRVKTDPTDTDGVMEYHCLYCNTERDEPIPAVEYPHYKKGIDNNYDETPLSWTYTYSEKAEALDVTFSPETYTNPDFKDISYYNIVILDHDGKTVGEYSGRRLANRTITVPGNSFSIVLNTDDGKTVRTYDDFVFAVTNVRPHCDHVYTVTERAEPTDTADGYIGYTCEKCKDSYRIPMKYIVPSNADKGPELDFYYFNRHNTDAETLRFNEYGNALYLGNENDPYVYLVSAASDDIETVDIAPTTRIIGSYAFKGCHNLTSVTIPERVVGIKKGAFSDCINLTELNINAAHMKMLDYKTMSSESGYAFTNAGTSSSGIAVTFGDSVDTIPENLFNCGYFEPAYITSVTVSSNVEFVGKYAFDAPLSVEYNKFDNGLYFGNERNKYVILVDTTSEIITSLTLPESVKTFYYNVFEDCTRLNYNKTVYGDYLGTAGNKYFALIKAHADNSGYFETEKTTKMIFWDALDHSPRSFITDSVTHFMDKDIHVYDVFCNRNSYTYSFLHTIQREQYYEIFRKYGSDDTVDSFFNLHLVDGFTPDGLGWHFDAKTLTLTVNGKGKMADNDNVGYNGVGPYGFIYGFVENLVIDDGVTYIGSYSFYGMDNLKTITFAESVKTIGKSAFGMCQGLERVVINSGVETIGAWAFRDCFNLKTVKLLAPVKTVGEYAFYGCTNLSSVTIENTVETVENHAFYECKNLDSLFISKSVTSYGDNSFDICGFNYRYEQHEITDVFFDGTEDEWSKQFHGWFNEYFGRVHYNSVDPDSSYYFVYNGRGLTFDIYDYSTANGIYGVDIAINGNEIEFSHKDYYTLTFPIESLTYTDEEVEICLVPTSTNSNVAGVHSRRKDGLIHNVVATKENNDKLDIKVYGAEGAQAYRLYQVNSLIAENETGEFTVEAVKLMEKSFSVQVKDSKGKWGKKIATDIEILNSVEIDVDMEDLFDFDIPEEIPLIGGKTMSVSLKDCPIGVNIDPDNHSFAIAIGIKKDLIDTGDDERKTNVQKFGESFKESFEKLGDDFDDYVPQKFGLQEAKPWKWGISFTYAGFIEGTYANDGILTISGNVFFELKGSGKTSWQFVVLAVPVTVSLKISAGVAVVLGIKYDGLRVKVLAPDVMITLPKITLSAGPGFPLLNASVYGEVANKIYISRGNTSASLKGECGVSVTALIIEEQIPIVSGEWVYYNSAGIKSSAKSPLLMSGTVPVDYYTEMLSDPNNYRINTAANTSAWLGERKLKQLEAGPSALDGDSITTVTLQKNVLTSAEPVIADADGARVMAWCETETTRSAADSSRLVYSVYDSTNDSWSSPRPVSDDGTADCDPAIATDGKDIYITWINVDSKLAGEVTLENLGEHLEISAAKFDSVKGTWLDAVCVTDNSVSDFAPTVYVEDGKAFVSWIENEDNSILLLDGTNKICFVTVDGKNVSAVKTLRAKTTPVYEVQTGRFGSTVCVATVSEDGILECVDTDGNLLYTGRSTGNNVRFVSMNGENVLLTNTADGFAAVRADGTVTMLAGADEIPAQFEALDLPDGKFATLAVLPGSNSDGEAGSNIYAYIFDGEQLGEPVRLTDSEKYTTSQSGVYSDGSIVTVYTNASAVITKEHVDTKADLCVTAARFVHETELLALSYDYYTAVAGKDTAVTAEVANRGFFTETELLVTVTDENGNVVVNDTVGCNIPAGSTREIGISVPIGEELLETADYTVTVQVADEGLASDNTRTMKFGLCDLTVELTPLRTGMASALKSTVKNLTSFTTDATLVVRSENRDGEVLAEFGIGAVTGSEGTDYIINSDTLSALAKDGDTLYIEAVSANEDCSSGNDSDITLVRIDESAETDGVTVSGVVTSYCAERNFTVELSQNGEVVYRSEFASGERKNDTVTGQFSLDGVSPGIYDLTVRKAGHLAYTVTGITVGDNDIDLTASAGQYSEIKLIAGDVDGDGLVNGTDVQKIRLTANINHAVEEAADALADVNGDGLINGSDVQVVRFVSNINKSETDCTAEYKG